MWNAFNVAPVMSVTVAHTFLSYQRGNTSSGVKKHLMYVPIYGWMIYNAIMAKRKKSFFVIHFFLLCVMLFFRSQCLHDKYISIFALRCNQRNGSTWYVDNFLFASLSLIILETVDNIFHKKYNNIAVWDQPFEVIVGSKGIVDCLFSGTLKHFYNINTFPVFLCHPLFIFDL